jgi:hypothetical protein
MAPKPEASSQAERQAAALARAGQGARTSAATYFRTGRKTGLFGANSHILPPVRVPANLALEMAAWGNEQGLTYSETVRSLLRRGLKTTKEQHHDDD